MMLSKILLTGSNIMNQIKSGKVYDPLISIERSVFGNLLNIVRIVGTGLALIMLTYMSISYLTADGSMLPFGIQRKANIKGEQLKNFALGVIVFIGASNILYFVEQLVESIVVDAFL